MAKAAKGTHNTTSNEFLEALETGDGWRWVNDDGNSSYIHPVVITYYFLPGGIDLPGDNGTSLEWLTVEKEAYEAAFQTWANVANITFREVYSADEATFVEAIADNASNPGAHYVPPDKVGGYTWGFYNRDQVTTSTGTISDSKFETFVHELGHGLGLEHPHETMRHSGLFPDANTSSGFVEFTRDTDHDGKADSWSLSDNELNQSIYTVMSYNRQAFVTGPSAFDIAAIQDLYGANTTYKYGNDTYLLGQSSLHTTIWDTGGTDEIIYNGSENVTINLNAATLENEPGGGGFVSGARVADEDVGAAGRSVGSFTIAGDYTNALPDIDTETGVIIENASGGSGDDILIGNGVANVLKGNGGDDIIRGGAGDDHIDGGEGDDVLLDGGEGDDYIVGMNGNDVIDGGDGNDTIDGGNGYDRIDGGAGDDTINGFYGGDIINGQSGDDTIDGYYGNDNIHGGAGNDTISGGADTDWIYGDDGEDHLTGDAGMDYLYGGADRDTIHGGYDNDFIYGEDGDDILAGGYGDDTIEGGLGNDTIYGGEFSPTQDRGVDTAVLSGNYSDYTIISIASGPNVILEGPDGTDTFYGIESFRFADRTVTLETLLNPGGVIVNPDPNAPEPVVHPNDDGLNITYVPPIPANEDEPVSGHLAVARGSQFGTTFVSQNGGRLVVAANGDFTYTPAQDFNGPDSVSYVLLDDQGDTISGTLNFEVAPVPDAPVANTDMFMVVKGTTEVVGNLFNNNGFGKDYDGDGDPLTVAIPGTHGTLNGGEVTIGANGDFTYKPPPGNFEGEDSFIYTLSDGTSVDSALAVFEIGPNIAPRAQDDAFTGNNGAVEDQEFSGNVLADNGNGADVDVNYNTTLSVVDRSVTSAQGGTVAIAENGDFTYTPPENFNGTDSFSYTVSDGLGGSDTATATIEVTPVEDAPVAQDDTFATAEDTPVSGNVLADNGNGADSDPDGDSLKVQPKTHLWTEHGGRVDIAINGDFTYTPPENFNGTDSFEYKVQDSWDSLPVTGTVTIEVAPANDGPTAADDAFVVAFGQTISGNVLADNGNGADSDPDGDPLTVESTTPLQTLVVGDKSADGPLTFATAQGGQVVLQENGDFTYTPAFGFHGADSFDYAVRDGEGVTDTATVSLSVALPQGAKVGTEQGDVLVGMFSSNDTVVGLGGNDVLSGLTGNDLLLGDAGDDALYGDAGNDVLAGGAGADLLDGGSGYDILVGGDGADILSGGSDSFFRNSGADAFVFNAGETGVDTITDFTLGEDAIDISGLIGDAFGVISSDLADFVRIAVPDGSSSADPIVQVDASGTGSAFVDIAVLNGLELGDQVSVTFNGTTTADVEIAVPPAPVDDTTPAPGEDAPVALPEDAIVGTGGDDTLVGSDGDDVIAGLDGDDDLRGADDWRSDGNDTLLGGGGDDALRGRWGDDVLDGGTGNDSLSGSRGHDVLAGGDGSDALTGGSDADTFLFHAAETGVDTITDFNLDEDVIDISGLIGDTFGVVSKDLADFVRIDDPDGRWGSDAPVLQVDATGTGHSFVDIALLNGLNHGDDVSVMYSSFMTADIHII